MPGDGARAEFLNEATGGALLRRAFQSSEVLLRSLPIGVCAYDADGEISYYNPKAVELWGSRPGAGDAVRFCGAARSYAADGALMEMRSSPVAEALRTGLAVADREVVFERLDGGRAHVLVSVEPLFDDRGASIGAVSSFQDITPRVRLEDQLIAQEAWYRGLLEALPAAIYTTDAEGRITFYNQAAVDFSGRRPQLGSDEWCVTWRLYTPDGAPLAHEDCPMAVALKEDRPIRNAEAVAERPDGSRAPFIPFPTPLHDAQGKLVGAVNMLVDITERKAAEDLQKTLMDELNHRVKNTLATVQSLAKQSFRADGDLAAMRAMFEARLMTLSETHNQLAARNWENADLAAIVQRTLTSHVDGSERVQVFGVPVRLTAHEAVSFAMLLNELTTNSLKHGALSVEDGRVSVWWGLGLDGLNFEWVEAGGPVVSAPARRGFGSRFIQGAVARDLGGKAQFDFAPSGLTCRITARLAS